jgi:hypothetical protein
VIVGRWKFGSHFPAVGGNIVDLRCPDCHPVGRVTAEDVEPAVKLGHRELAVGCEKLGAVRPLSRLLRESGGGKR